VKILDDTLRGFPAIGYGLIRDLERAGRRGERGNMATPPRRSNRCQDPRAQTDEQRNTVKEVL